MKVTCIHHAFLREKIGRDTDVLEVPGALALQDVIDWLAARYPELAEIWPRVKYAVNDEFVPAQTALNEGDRIDVLPPFGGG